MYVQLSDDLGWKIDVKTVLPIATDRSLTLWTDRSVHPTDMDMYRCLVAFLNSMNFPSPVN